MSDEKKTWERPWYPKEIAENASNWSFAADLSLLKYLEIFSEDILNRATTVDNNVNNLLNNLSQTSLSLDIARNKFLSLSNTQFIESRVYEDDETALTSEEKGEEEEPNKNNSEEINKNEMRLAALRGIEMIDKYFDKVKVVDSDSEEDSDLTSFVLRPKDQYIDRPLPYVIGTEEWHKKPHVGLDDSSSESEHEKLSEKFSDDESESDLPITNRSQAKSISENGSSEADLSNKLDQPVANSTFNDTNKDYYQGSSEDFNSLSLPDSASQNSFAEQLAAKLGNVINHTAEEPTINTRPIQKISHYDKYGNTFSDEPPPLDDDEEFSPKSKDQGIFSGGDGLFDDLNDDEPFWGSGVGDTQVKANANFKRSEHINDILGSNPKKVLNTGSDFKNELSSKINKLAERNLFDAEVESDEDSLFKKPTTVQRTTNKPKKQESLFDDDDTSDDASSLQTKDQFSDRIPGSHNRRQDRNSSFEDEDSLNVDSPEKKVPAGGVKVINNPNIFAGQDIKKLLKNKRQSSSESSENEVPKNDLNKLRKEIQENKKAAENVKEIVSAAPQKNNQINNLFDDDDEEDDLFQNDLFSNISSKKTTSNLFGKTSDSLFDDSDEFNEEDRLDNAKTMSSTKIPEAKQPKKVMEDNTSARHDETIDTNRATPKDLSKKFDDPLLDSDTANTDHFGGKIEKNIFAADDESDSDDLFSSKYSKIISKNKVIEHISSSSEKKNAPISEEVTSSKWLKEKSKKVPSLFDDDDDDDNQDDDVFSSNFLQSNKAAHSTQKPESKLDSKLFEDVGEDDLFSTNDVLNDNCTSIFEDRNFIKGSNVTDSSKKRDIFIKDVSVESNDSSKGDVEIFQANTESKNLVNKVLPVEENDITRNKTDENLLIQKNPVLDKLFEDGDYNKDLFKTKTQKTIQKSLVSTNVEAVKEHAGDDMQTTSDVLSNQNRSSPLKGEQHNNTKNNNSKESVKNDGVAYDNVDRMIPETKSSVTDNLTQNLFDFQSEKSKKEDEVYVKGPSMNSENILSVVKEENVERSFLKNSVPPAEDMFSPMADRVPSLNIFDPNPPPDLDDWETRSEQNIFDDDIYSFDNTENFNENRSSIFDREPPSVFNETGGIVRDQSRGLDTDPSSFYPYATSSRFSNDFLSEERSGDSLFATKNNFLEPTIPSSIIEGPEDSFSTTDVTPSDKLDDIYSESSELHRPKSVTFEADSSNKNHEQVSIKDDTSKQGTEDTKPEKLKPSLSKKPNIPKKPIAGSHEKPKEDINDDKQEETHSKQEVPGNNEEKSIQNRGSPTKLKHNLDINVFALLPGAGKHLKKESPVKEHISQPFQRSTSLDLETYNLDANSQLAIPPKKDSHKPAQNERNIDVEVLQTVTKNRARGPVKRRPPTKRGRDAIRNSCIDFTFISSPSVEGEHNKDDTGSPSETQSASNASNTTVNQTPKVLTERIHSENLETLEVSKSSEDVNKEAELHSSGSDKEGINLVKHTEDLHGIETTKQPRQNILADDKDGDDIFSNFKVNKPDDTLSSVPSKKSEFFDILQSISFDDEENPLQASLFDNQRESLQSGVTGGGIQKAIKEGTDTTTFGTSTKNESKMPGKNVDHEKDNYPQTDILFEATTKPTNTNKVEKSRKTGNLFDDDTDDDDLFSSTKNRKSENTRSSLKIVDSHKPNSTVRQSTSAKSDKLDFLHDAEDDIFKKMEVKPKKTDISKRLPFEDDDDDDLFGETSNTKLQVTSTASSSRRLKPSNLKKLENTVLTGDDPLNALNN